jgi:sulfonate transport system substrate-binding protein
VWEPFTSLEVIQFAARVLADARGLTPSASLLAASVRALRDKRPQIADFVARQAQGWAWARTHLPDYARSTAQLIRLPEPVVQRAYKVNDTRAVPIDDALIREFQTAVDRAVADGIVSRHFDVAESVDKNFLPAVRG